MEQKIKVFATNGEWFKEFLYFVQNPKGDFYYGNIGPEISKTSIRASGVAHMRTGQHRIPLGRGTKLAESKGMRQLFAMSIGSLVFPNPAFGKPYSGRVSNALITIDIRRFKTDIGIMAFLLEPEQGNELNKLLGIIHEPQFNIITQTNPWLVLTVHTFKQQEKPGAI